MIFFAFNLSKLFLEDVKFECVNLILFFFNIFWIWPSSPKGPCNALKQINNLLSSKDEGSFFRIAIKGGGCSGFQYDFSFDKTPQDDDLRQDNILIDKTSADLLKGSEIDFVKELIGDQFKINNPQSKSSCGCGVSFSL